jgi:hypothetical protein
VEREINSIFFNSGHVRCKINLSVLRKRNYFRKYFSLLLLDLGTIEFQNLMSQPLYCLCWMSNPWTFYIGEKLYVRENTSVFKWFILQMILTWQCTWPSVISWCREGNFHKASPCFESRILTKFACINHVYCTNKRNNFLASACFGSRVLKKFACMNHGYCTNKRNNFYGICVFRITGLEKICVYKPRRLSELLENLRVSIQGSWQIFVYKSRKYLICRVFIHGSCKIAMIWTTDILWKGKFMPK